MRFCVKKTFDKGFVLISSVLLIFGLLLLLIAATDDVEQSLQSKHHFSAKAQVDYCAQIALKTMMNRLAGNFADRKLVCETQQSIKVVSSTPKSELLLLTVKAIYHGAVKTNTMLVKRLLNNGQGKIIFQWWR